MKIHKTEISFYKLTTLPIQKAAPKLIEKIYYSKQNLVVIAQDDAMMKLIDDGLWVYSTKHFIPHANCYDEFKEDQPVYITTKLEKPNGANIIMLLGFAEFDNINAERIIFMFDGNVKEQLEFARKKWKSYQSNNYNLIYWQQTLEGSWEKVNS